MVYYKKIMAKTKSKFIAIEGLDGAGKSTQIKLLTDYLSAKDIQIKFVHFPRSGEGVFGEMVARFLRGEYGAVDTVHPQLVALMFAQDRKDFATTINKWLEDGYFVIVDRYVLSNIAFQCAKIKDAEEKLYLQQWISDFEYGYNGIPKPDLSIYLDVPFTFTEKALNKRKNDEDRAYLNGKEDIHENDFSLQLAVKLEYEKLVNKHLDITRITCYNSDNEMKSIDQIHKEILSSIKM
jgi:dTMP kinase